MKVNRSIQLYVLSSLRIPFTRGIIQPKIYLPGEARHWTVSELEGVLAHEIAHIKRFDVLIIYLQTLSKIFYFFHPAIWWINHLLDLERERICDDMAIETVGLDRWQYGHDLFSRLEQSLQNPQAPLLASGFLISKKSLFHRFEYIIHSKGGSMKPWKPVQKVMSVFAVTVAILISCTLHKNTFSPAKNPPANDISEAVQFVPYDTPPEPLTRISPTYPPEAREAGIEGTVILQLLISKEGKTAKTNIIQGVDGSGLNDAAVTAIKDMSWKPALFNDEPVSVWITLPLHFKLDKEKSDSE